MADAPGVGANQPDSGGNYSAPGVIDWRVVDPLQYHLVMLGALPDRPLRPLVGSLGVHRQGCRGTPTNKTKCDSLPEGALFGRESPLQSPAIATDNYTYFIPVVY